MSLRYWTASWTSLSAALISLFIGFHIEPNPKLLYSFYFFGEYLFGLFFIAGCHIQVSRAPLHKRSVYFLVPVLILALVLPYVSSDFNDLFMIHAVIVALLFLMAFLTLLGGFKRRERTPGVRVMLTALGFLSVGFLHYIPVFGARKGLWGYTVPVSYFQYTSMFDLFFEILLGFGTVMVLMESVRREVELANQNLMEARDKLELLAQMDPLTEALNRHAFHSLLRKPENGQESKTSGSVAVIDIDNLKPINDTFGHTAGDKAIRSVARAMRSLVRADDMLFRWGGDEFLVLMFNLPKTEAQRRMEKLNGLLAENGNSWTRVPTTVTVSFGVAGFGALTELGNAIEAADKAMYAQRHQTRGINKPVELPQHTYSEA
ncbi:MAG TPA: diguanylate cyclase [Pyrinomonadaceae bacterium]|nr:diguanylate cyclase [Pyrinomonadaceae bacterium]